MKDTPKSVTGESCIQNLKKCLWFNEFFKIVIEEYAI